MSTISPEDMERYRSLLLAIDMPEAEKDECIRTVFNIVSSFVDQAFGLHSAQISLKDRANKAFSHKPTSAMIAIDPKAESVDLLEEGAINTQYT